MSRKNGEYKCKYCGGDVYGNSLMCNRCKENLPLVRELIKAGQELKEILERKARENDEETNADGKSL
jgi:hypothetical protein